MTIDSFGIYSEAEKTVRLCGRRDPVRAARELGIYVDCTDGFNFLLGMYTVVNGERHILLNSSLGRVTQNIVCAHELGHERLHSRLREDNYYYSDLGLRGEKSRTEYEANAFAAHFLIGNDDIIERMEVYSDVMSLARDLNTEADLVLIKLSEMRRLGYDVNVPMETDGGFLADLGADSSGEADGFSDGV